MAYVVTEACIRCRYMDCVEVCPVDCFYEGETMLVIHPDQCIDCGVCVPECPINAIYADTDSEGQDFAELNRTLAEVWPNATQSKGPLPNADRWAGVRGKYPKWFPPDEPLTVWSPDAAKATPARE